MDADRIPVLVGAGQVIQRVADWRDGREPLELMAEACERAAEDAGAPELLARADSIRVPHGLWKYANPNAWLAERFGAKPSETVIAPVSGTTVQTLLHEAAEGILAGERDIVLVVGGEAEHSNRRAKRAGDEVQRSDTPDVPLTDQRVRAYDFRESTDFQAGLKSPTIAFAMFETALRHRRGRSVEAHQQKIAELWSGLARVAADNPYAWIRDAPSAEFLATPGEDNRMLVAPYSKYLVANMVVDLAACVILVSSGTARRLGIPEERWVHPQLAVHSPGSPAMSHREELAFERAMEIAAQRLLSEAGVDADAIGPVDLYSCFPSAVQLSAEAIGLPETRPLSVTGGLTFGGGPFNSYVLHSLATTIGRLRDAPGALGLVSSVGGLMSSHAYGLYGTAPPERPFRRIDVSDAVEAQATRPLREDHRGEIRVETYVVHHDAARPTSVLVAARTPDGARQWATSDDAGLAAEMTTEDWVGREGRIDAEGRFVG